MRFCPNCNRPNNNYVRYCFDCGSALSAVPVQKDVTGSLRPNTILSERYIVIQRVGRGGMGAVYKGIDMHVPNTYIAVKEMSDSFINDFIDREKAVEAFKQEAQILAVLRHENLPHVTDFFVESGKEYLVMDFIDGKTLKEVLKDVDGFLKEDTVRKWAIQLCDVLDYLHSRKPPVIFRDLKPANIMLEDKTEKIKLIDFGIARLFKPGQRKDTFIMATEGYSPPEQMGTKQTDARSDIYALGATLHHLLSNRNPKETPYFFPSIRSINPAVSEHFEEVINRAVQHKPSNRWQTILEMKKALMENVPLSVSSSPPPLPKKDVANRRTFKPKGFVVSPSGDGGYRTINEALAAVPSGGKIILRPGKYRERVVLNKKVEITGEGDLTKIIIENDGCVFMNTEEAVIRNMTLISCGEEHDLPSPAVDISMGSLYIENCHISSKSSCISIHGYGANPVIRKCVIKNAAENGVNIYDGAKGTIENCEITDNSKFGIVIYLKGNPVIRNCMICNGKNYGIKVYQHGEGIIEDCDIFGNGKSGMLIQDRGNPSLKRCKIHNESRGIIISDNGAGKFKDCNIYANRNASVEISDNGNPIFQDCKIFDGRAQGIYIYSKGAGNIEDCEIFRNNGIGIEISTRSNPVIRRCKIYECRLHGIYVCLNGSGSIEDSHIFSNTVSSIEIAENSNPVIKGCKFV